MCQFSIQILLHLSINHDANSAAQSICLFHIVGCQNGSTICILKTGTDGVPKNNDKNICATNSSARKEKNA